MDKSTQRGQLESRFDRETVTGLYDGLRLLEQNIEVMEQLGGQPENGERMME